MFKYDVNLTMLEFTTFYQKVSMSELDFYIRKLSFFSSLSNEQLTMLTKMSTIKKYATGSILQYENDSSNKIYFLLEGLIKAYKIDKYENEIFLYHIYENNMISELTSIASNSILCYSNTEFTKDSMVLEIDFTKFKNEFLSKNILTQEFIDEILKKTSQLFCVINRELVFDATAKVANLLYDDLNIFNSKKRQEISFMLHIQPETLSRVLKKLARENIIEIDKSIITILNYDKLSSIFKGDVT